MSILRPTKERLTVTVDPHLVEAGNQAVAAGTAESLSAWVNLALAERAAKERRLRALGEAVAAYERDFGVITDAEIEAQPASSSLPPDDVTSSTPPSCCSRPTAT
jgi:hypothetical protein